MKETTECVREYAGVKEYVGITGFKTLDEIRFADEAFREAGITKDRDTTAMYGFLVSARQITDEKMSSGRFPSLKNLPDLLEAVPEGMLPAIHYCSAKRELDVEKVSRILTYGGIAEYITKKGLGLQLNLDWPEPSSIKELKDIFPQIYIIQQVNPALQSIDETARLALRYEGIVDKLLIDPSLGAGIAYDAQQTARVIVKISGETSLFSYVVCGGLDGDGVRQRVMDMRKLIKDNAHLDVGQSVDFSVDAEGRLRTPDGRALDKPAVQKYISESAKALMGKKHH